jgi:UDP-N-acetylmuramate dehydrogenase
MADGRLKIPAAWLIERAGFTRGYAKGRAAISSKHTLALVNRGGASARELIELAREITDGVRTVFGIQLAPEPVFIGFPAIEPPGGLPNSLE